MNLIDAYVIKVVVKTQKIENHVYSKTILIDSYGRQEEKIITGDWNYVRKFKVGYKFLE